MVGLDMYLGLGPPELAQSAGRLWTPADMDVLAYYDASASQLTVESGEVLGITDLSGNDFHLAAESGTAPALTTLPNGRVALDFSALQRLKRDDSLGLSGTPEIHTFAGYYLPQASVSSSCPIWGLGDEASSPPYSLYCTVGTSKHSYRYNNGNELFSSEIVGRPVLTEWAITPTGRYDSNNLRLDGAYTYAGTTGSSGGSQIYNLQNELFVIGYLSGSTTAIVGAIPALVVVAGEISDDDRQKLEGWFAWEMGSVDYLPADHPYKEAPPWVGPETPEPPEPEPEPEGFFANDFFSTSFFE